MLTPFSLFEILPGDEGALPDVGVAARRMRDLTASDPVEVVLEIRDRGLLDEFVRVLIAHKTKRAGTAGSADFMRWHGFCGAMHRSHHPRHRGRTCTSSFVSSRCRTARRSACIR